MEEAGVYPIECEGLVERYYPAFSPGRGSVGRSQSVNYTNNWIQEGTAYTDSQDIRDNPYYRYQHPAPWTNGVMVMVVMLVVMV